MNRPPPPIIINNMHRGPRPFNNRWRPRGPYPPTGFQFRPNTNYRAPIMNPINQDNKEHWCETCDRAFPTADLLDKHKQQHQTCNIDGCKFVAHPKVITKHIQMQHSSGLYKKIAKLDNPEEINKWREERKNKYPTRTNIEKKAAECKEKIERGEKMALKRDRHNNHKSSDDQVPGNNRRHNFDKRDQNHRANIPNFNQRQNHISNNRDQPPAKKIPKVIPKIPSAVEKNKLKPFAGILSIVMDDSNNEKEDVCDRLDCDNTLIEDDYYEEPILDKSPKTKPAQEPVLCGALTSLMCDYGSSDEETEGKENKTLSNTRTPTADSIADIDKNSVKKDVEHINNGSMEKEVVVSNDINKDVESNSKELLKKDVAKEIKAKPNNNDEKSDDDSPEEVKTVKIDVGEPSCAQQDYIKNIKQAMPLKKNMPCRNNNKQNKYKYRIPSTLLHKLLQKEIRQERNIVLQCIRYIKKNNYFDKTSQ